MATVTLEISGSDVGTVTLTDTLDKGNSDRFMSWLAAAYGTGVNEDGSPKVRNPAEMVEACWNAVRSGIFNNIVSWEKDQAAQAAREAVQEMDSSTVTDYKPPV